jgi:multidrug efflux pump subunit AcrA (membrane-fusion protein)
VKGDLGSVSGMVEVVVEILDGATSPSVGSFVTVIVPTGKEEKVVSVPRSALLRTSEGNFVYTVSGERFVRAAVKLGVVNGEFAEVADGLYAGDQIALKPVMTLWLAELQAIRGGKACSDD